MTATWMGPRALARACGLSTDTLRHYERMGLLPGTVRTNAGYRRYRPESVERVRLIQRALTIGFSLRELSSVLQRREHGEPPCQRVRALVGERLAALDTKLEELTRLREDMRRLVRDWDVRLANTPHGQRARLLDALAVEPGASRRRGMRAR